MFVIILQKKYPICIYTLCLIIIIFFFRKCFCDSSDPSGAQSAERGQLPDPLPGGGGSARRLSCHAPGGSLRGQQRVDPGPRALRHVDIQRCPLLHCLHPTPGCHRT